MKILLVRFGFFLVFLNIVGYIVGFIRAINIAQGGTWFPDYLDLTLILSVFASLYLYLWMFYDLIRPKNRELFKAKWFIFFIFGAFLGSCFYFIKIYRKR